MNVHKCRDCGTTEHGGHWTRGLCRRCYGRHHNAETLDQFPMAPRANPPAKCTRCGVMTRHETRECGDCRGIEKRITQAEPLNGRWINDHLVMRHVAA